MRKALTHLKKSDPIMAAIIQTAGPYSIQYREPVFETLVRSIVYQQLNGKAAKTIYDRLQARTGAPITPQAILRLRQTTLRKVGLSQQKAIYVRELARTTRDGQIVFDQFREMPDDRIIEILTQVKGVGVWTVQMFLMFALQRHDVLPLGDLGVRAAMKKAYALEELPKPAEMEKLAEPWRPYRSIASWYLWRSLENEGAM